MRIFKYKLTLEYDGTGYRGWQAQQNARSVQETLQQAANRIFGTEVDVQGAGRTDAGVHALGQVAHLAAPRKMPTERLLYDLNDLLPATINILHIEEASPDFHARHDARKRVYIYVISQVRTAFAKRYVWWVRDRLHINKMVKAAGVFEGFHDFASFADRRMEKNASTKVHVERSVLEQKGDCVIMTVAGSHFLWKMVRRMAGILVEVGRGTLTEGDVLAMLTGHSELPARHTAPPSGLFLAQVLYDGDSDEPVRLPLWIEYQPELM